MIISVDHGNKSIKTPNALFTSGLIVSEGLQGFKTDYICWNNKYYTLTEQRIAYLRDKTEDERFYVLTLFAIAKELERRKVPETLDPIDIIPTPTGKKPCWTISSVTYILGNDRYCGDVIMQKSLCVDLFAHKRVRNLGQVERYRMRDVHPPLISKEEWREAKNRISMPDREAVILEEITGEGILSSLHPILFKEDIDV